MDRAKFDSRRTTGSVKAAVNLYGDKALEGSPSLKKPQMDFPEKSSLGAREAHEARRDISRYKESKKAAELARAQAESELSNAKKTVKDLSVLTDELNTKAKAQMQDVEMLKKSGRCDEKALAGRNIESYQYEEVMRDWEFVKRELGKLKFDMAYVLEEKLRMEKQVKASSSKMLPYPNSVEALWMEIGGANEEQVLVELARIEALKEFGEIEAQRVKGAIEFSDAMEKTKQKIKDTFVEIDQSKELEAKLTSAMSDVHVLQKELKLVKEMKAKVQRNDSLCCGSFRKGKELGTSPSLQSITEELEAVKKELAMVREEGFQFMTSMDITRDELKHVTKETVQLKKTEEKTDLTVQNLNSKLLRAKSKLEVASAAEEKAKSILSNLSLTLEQLKTEAESAKKEKELNTAETATIKADIQKTESEIDLTEERLQAAMEKLEVVKSSEALALENLRTLIEKTMTARALATQHSSKITISKFEYEYLTGRAVQAEEIADKKVAAADAWTEALKASEKEILMKTELAQRKIKEIRVEEEQESYRARRSLSAKRIVEGELQNRRQKREKNAEAENLQLALHRKSMKSNANFTPSRRAKFQKSASPAPRKSASPGTRHLNLFTIKKKKKVMPNLAKLFIGKRNEKDLKAT